MPGRSAETMEEAIQTVDPSVLEGAGDYEAPSGGGGESEEEGGLKLYKTAEIGGIEIVILADPAPEFIRSDDQYQEPGKPDKFFAVAHFAFRRGRTKDEPDGKVAKVRLSGGRLLDVLRRLNDNGRLPTRVQIVQRPQKSGRMMWDFAPWDD